MINGRFDGGMLMMLFYDGSHGWHNGGCLVLIGCLSGGLRMFDSGACSTLFKEER